MILQHINKRNADAVVIFKSLCLNSVRKKGILSFKILYKALLNIFSFSKSLQNVDFVQFLRAMSSPLSSVKLGTYTEVL